MPTLEVRRLGLAQRPPDLAGDRPSEEPAAHPDPAVNPPAVDRVAGFDERPLPGEDVGVDRVDEGPVEIEDESAHVRQHGTRPLAGP